MMACSKLRTSFAHAMRWNKEFSLLTFVMPFIVPQQNPVGRLMPRFDLRNPVHFVERLNEVLEQEMAQYRKCFYFDFNAIAASHGKRYIFEDHVAAFNHGSFIFDCDFLPDQNRMESVQQATHLFGSEVELVLRSAWRELTSMYRTARQSDAVKLVIFDLDDTLWRGVAAEVVNQAYATAEGWPKALWETCLFLKRRGVMLAIVSKNSEETIRGLWADVLGGSLELDDFAVRRINWEPKAKNIAEVLAAVNILPESAVYIDDNPLERAAVGEAFPDLRILGGNPVAWRRILLWSSELQVAEVSRESAERTAMVQAQVLRDKGRRTMDHETFLAQLDVKVQPIIIENIGHPRFGRALELINKTNQFNTSGFRRTEALTASHFENGTRFVAFEIRDRYTSYGLVAVAVVTGGTIDQFVMSCRVVGIGAESAAIYVAIREIERNGFSNATGIIRKTNRNLPCQDLYERLGFVSTDEGWVCAVTDASPVPSHIELFDTEALTVRCHPM